MNGIIISKEFIAGLAMKIADVLSGSHCLQDEYDYKHTTGDKKKLFFYVCDQETAEAIDKVLDYLYGKAEENPTQRGSDEQV